MLLPLQAVVDAQLAKQVLDVGVRPEKDVEAGLVGVAVLVPPGGDLRGEGEGKKKRGVLGVGGVADGALCLPRPSFYSLFYLAAQHVPGFQDDGDVARVRQILGGGQAGETWGKEKEGKEKRGWVRRGSSGNRPRAAASLASARSLSAPAPQPRTHTATTPASVVHGDQTPPLQSSLSLS
jgi:hypothetical protein